MHMIVAYPHPLQHKHVMDVLKESRPNCIEDETRIRQVFF